MTSNPKYHDLFCNDKFKVGTVGRILLAKFKQLNPTPVGGGVFRPPYQKMAITPKNNDPKEPKLCDFSYISMTNPPIPFWGLKMAKNGVL